MKRNAPDLKYYYHVVMTGNSYKVKRSLFVKTDNSVAYFSTKEQAERLAIVKAKEALNIK